MPNVKYNLKPGEGARLIMLCFRVYDKKFQYSTGEKIREQHWDKQKCRPMAGQGFRRYRELNHLLDKMAFCTKEAYRRFLNDHAEEKVSIKDLWSALRSSLDELRKKGMDGPGEIEFFDFCDQVIEQRERSPAFSKGTIKDYKTALARIKEFADNSHIRTDFDTINLEWSLDFQEWCFSPPRLYSNNYTRKLLKHVRTFMSEATERGINNNMAYLSRRFQISEEESDNIYLSEEELIELFQMDLSSIPRLDKVRDIFLTGCYTGLRISDLSRIASENLVTIDGEDYLRIRPQKEPARVTIPLHQVVRAIFDKWEGPPSMMTEQKINEYVKELCLRTKWGQEQMIVSRSVGGKRVDQKFQKAKLVSMHTARRSFATNAYKAGVPTKLIMSITGHKTEKAFYKYIKLSDEEAAVIVNQSDFFRRLRVV